MKLLRELLELRILSEEEEENKDEETDMKKQLQDMFTTADGAGNLQPYVKDELIDAKAATAGDKIHVNFPNEPVKDVIAKNDDMIIRMTDNTNAVKVMSKRDFENEYEPDKSNSQADAEGFITYRPKGQILAFQYSEHEPLTLQDEQGHTIHVKFGDYLGYPLDDSSTLIQLDKSHFEDKYRLAD